MKIVNLLEELAYLPHFDIKLSNILQEQNTVLHDAFSDKSNEKLKSLIGNHHYLADKTTVFTV